MKILLAHPTGNQNVRAAARGLNDAKLLAQFYTTFACFPGSILDQLGTSALLSEIHRRRFDPSLERMTKIYPWRELGRLLSLKFNLNRLIQHETGWFSIDSVYQSLDKKVASTLNNAYKKGINAVYAYEDGAASTFAEAKRLGYTCIYDLPTGYWRAAHQILQDECELWPAWIPTMTGFQDSAAKLFRKDEELRLADQIIVASQFTAETLKKYSGPLAPISGPLAPIKIIPYGYPEVSQEREYFLLKSNRPLKLLFVGKLSQQKGIRNLFSAVEGLKKNVKLTIVGHKANNDCPILDFELAKHNWIPSLSHKEVLELMRENDVLIFPSLFDGFGLVITEAMSQGTPVISTERCGGPDLIQHGDNGWIVEAGSTQALRTAIEEILIKPKSIINVGREAMQTALKRPWKVYEKELAESIIG